MADDSILIKRTTRSEIYEMIEKYMKELDVPHSRKEHGVVPTEGMTIVPAHGNTANDKRKLQLEFKSSMQVQGSSNKRTHTHGLSGGSNHDSTHRAISESDIGVNGSKRCTMMTYGQGEGEGQGPSSEDHLHSKTRTQTDERGLEFYRSEGSRDVIENRQYNKFQGPFSAILRSPNYSKNHTNSSTSQNGKCHSHPKSETFDGTNNTCSQKGGNSRNTDDLMENALYKPPVENTSTPPDGEGSIDVEDVAVILLKAKEEVFPFSRKTRLRHLIEKNKPPDANIASCEDEQACKAYLVTNYLQPFIEKRVMETVSFAKMIPGFKELPMVDRITLVRESRLLCASITGFVYDFDTKIVYMDDGTPLTVPDLNSIFGMEEVMARRIDYVHKVDSLQLTASEEATLRAIAVFAPLDNRDPWKLEDRARAISIYDNLKSCLRHEVTSYHEKPALRIKQLHELLKLCLVSTDMNLGLLRKQTEHWPSTFKNSVANEIYDLM